MLGWPAQGQRLSCQHSELALYVREHNDASPLLPLSPYYEIPSVTLGTESDCGADILIDP